MGKRNVGALITRALQSQRARDERRLRQERNRDAAQQQRDHFRTRGQGH